MATVFLIKSAGRGQGSSVVEAEAEIRGGVVAIVTEADGKESVYTKGQWFPTSAEAETAINAKAEAEKARKAKALPDKVASLRAQLREVLAEAAAAGVEIPAETSEVAEAVAA